MLGLAFALAAVAVGLAGARALRPRHEQLALAPVIGLAALPVLSLWLGVLGVPLWLRGATLLVLGVWGVVASTRAVRAVRLELGWTGALLAVAVVTPALILGLAFAGLEVPPSAHDGAFHVETIDAIRRGAPVSTWYPTGFHSMLAALLSVLPWLDTARGTLELTQGLAVIAPLCVFGLGVSLGMRPIVAAGAAAIEAVTFLFPYDYHLWGGWPLGMGVLLAVGVWTAALWWLRQPDPRWAVVAGGLGGAIVLTHGTEVYTAALGLLVLATVHARQVDIGKLARHTPLALAVATLVALPYLSTLLGWAGAGGASGTGANILDITTANPDDFGRANWLQFGLGITGAGSPIDLPLRLGLVAAALWHRPPRALVALWLAFTVLLFVLDFLSFEWFNRVFVLTFPWLVDHRPRQVAVTLATLLEAYGIAAGLGYVAMLRSRWSDRPWLTRRLLVACALVLGFVAEGNAVGIYKRLAQGVADQNLYSVDDGAAMSWLRQHLGPGDVLANDQAADAGIWAPYKANVPILLPRSLAGDLDDRQSIVEHVLDVDTAPSLEAQACALGVSYLYQGALDSQYDPRLLPPRSELERAPELEPVFRSGAAVVFRIRLPCAR